jgi:hypothetical protein
MAIPPARGIPPPEEKNFLNGEDIEAPPESNSTS